MGMPWRERVTCQPGQVRERPWQGHGAGLERMSWRASLGQPRVLPWLRPPGPSMEQAGLQGTGRGQGAGGRQSHLGPQLPTGSRQASSSRLTLVRREQKAVSEATPPHPAEAGETPNDSKPGSQPWRPGVSAETGAALGRDSPSCLLGRCPQGGRCLRGTPEGKQRAGVTHR